MYNILVFIFDSDLVRLVLHGNVPEFCGTICRKMFLEQTLDSRTNIYWEHEVAQVFTCDNLKFKFPIRLIRTAVPTLSSGSICTELAENNVITMEGLKPRVSDDII